MTQPSDINEVLRQLVKLQAARGPLPSASENATISSALLGSPDVEKYNFTRKEEQDPRGPSPLMRVLDVMSRPLYAGMNVAKQDTEELGRRLQQEGPLSPSELLPPVRNPKESLSRFWEGLSGRDKTTGSDLIDDVMPGSSGPGKFGASLALDIAGDPLTYLGGFGLAGRIGQGTRKSIESLRAVEEGTEAASREIVENISRRAAGLAENPPTPRPEIPLRGLEQEPPRLFEAGPGPTGRLAISDKPAEIREIITPPTEAPVKSVTDLLQATIAESSQGRNWQNLARRQAEIIPEGAGRSTIREILELQLDSTRSPVYKNMIRKQIEKLDAGVVPAVAAKPTPVEFPKITLSQQRQTAATDIAERFARTNTFEEINAIGQTNLFNRVQTWVKKNIPPRAQQGVMLQMLRVAEDNLMRSGRKFVDAEGHTARLSDVAMAGGGSKALTTEMVDSFRKGRPLQALEDTKAANAPVLSQDILDPILQTARKTADAANQVLAPSRTKEIGGGVATQLANIAREAGASAAEARKAKSFMQDFFNPNRDELYEVVAQEARRMVRRAVADEVDPQMIHRVNSAVYKTLEGNPKLLGKAAAQTRVVEAIMTRMATWWNAKDLRPFLKEHIDTARNIAAAFERAMTPLVRSSTASQRTTAFRAAQGKVPPDPSNPELAGQFQALVENLMGTHGAKNTEAVVFRSGLTMKEVNKELPEQLRFINTKGTDTVGREFDYRAGDWMHSWKEWNIKEPAEALYQLTRALQLTTRKNAFLDDAAARWGMPVRGGEFQHPVNIERLKGFYFPKQIANQLDSVWHRLETDKFKQGPSVMQLFDKVQRMWKTGVTIYSPSHHIRNLNGDIYLAALDGVMSPAPYATSAKILFANRGRYKDMERVQNIMDPKLKEQALTSKPGDHALTTARGHNMTIQQVYEAAESQGFLLRAPLLEDLVGDVSQLSGTFGPRFAPFGGHVHRTAAGASEMRDHFVRMAHFVDVLKKSKARNLRDAIEEAGRRVKRWHPDGSDLTGFEQTYMRRLVPFYSWLRKSTPLIFEGMAMRPHITLAFPKTMANMQEITGIESQGPGDPFPMDQMFPEWLREKGIGPMIPEGHPMASIGRQETWKGETPGHVIINPTNPFTDQISEMGNPRKGITGSLTPAVGLPIELLQGETALGIPFEHVEGGVAGHLASQVPAVGIGSRITGMSRPDEPWQPEQLINWLLTGGLVTGTGPYEQQASFEIQEYMDQIARQARRKER